MIIQFVKDEGLPIVLCSHPHMPLQYRKRISASETVCELWFGVLLKKTTVILLLYYLMSLLSNVLACATPTHLDKKAFTFCTLNLNPSTSCFKIESYLLPNDDQLSLMQRLLNAFSEICFLALISPSYCEG